MPLGSGGGSASIVRILGKVGIELFGDGGSDGPTGDD